MNHGLDWLSDSPNTIAVLAAIATATWVLTLILVPWFIGRLPANYFTGKERRPVYADSLHPILGWLLATLKNILGVVLIVAGLVMLFAPGQGLATLVVGLMLLNFPGKYQLEQRLARRPAILNSLNWLRAKIDKPPLLAPGKLDAEQP